MTRKLASTIVVVFALGLAALAQAPAAPAAGPTPTKIGIINIQAAIMATNEGQRDFQALEKKFEPRRTELQKVNTDVEEMKKQLTAQQDKLNEQARADMMKNIEAKQKNLQRSYEDAQADWTNQQNDIAGRIGGKLLEVMEKYATDNGYAVILDVSSQTSPVLWASAATNVTKPIVDAYNAQSGVPAQPATAGAAAPKAPSAVKPATTPASKPATPASKPATPAPKK